MELTEILEHIRRYANRNPELIYFAISGIVVLFVILFSLPKKQKVKHLTSIGKIAQQIRDLRESGVFCFPEKIEAKWVGKIQPKIITDKQEYLDIQTDYAKRYIRDIRIRAAFYDCLAGEPLRFVKQFWKFTDNEMKILEQHISDFESEYRFEKKIKGQEIDILVYEETGYVPDSIKKSYKIWKRGQIYKELANYPWTPQTHELGDPVYSNGKLVGNVVKYVNDRTCEVKTPEPEVTEREKSIKIFDKKTKTIKCDYWLRLLTGKPLTIDLCMQCSNFIEFDAFEGVIYCKQIESHPAFSKYANYQVKSEPTNTIECEKDNSTQNSVKVKVYKNGKFKNNWYLSKDKSQSIEKVCKALKDVNKFSDADIKRIKPQLQDAWDKWVEIPEPKPPVKPDTDNKDN